MVWAVSLSTMDLITHCLTPIHYICGIRSLSELGNPGWAPHPNSALPPRCLYEAIPKYISERTSYRPAWLAFHSYPQIIRRIFNSNRFGPPLSVTLVSACSWIDRTGFGSTSCNYIALLRLAFAAAPPNGLTSLHKRNSLAHNAKGTRSHWR